MKTEQPILITSIKCPETTGITKNHFVTFTGHIGVEGIKSLGVCNTNTDLNEMMPVIAQGIALVYTGMAIPLGNAVQAFDDGTAVPLDSGPLEGYAMDVSTGTGQLIRILLA
ncbi:MAG TPA: DUF2190 family protein [Ignavibacteriaceae bacterium]|nr:DUF2190 family protein [Ignavibacteriaceae bacterium]